MNYWNEFKQIFKIQNFLIKTEIFNFKISIERRLKFLEDEHFLIKEYFKDLNKILKDDIINNLEFIKMKKEDLKIILNDSYQNENIIKYIIFQINKNINIIFLDKILIFINNYEIIEEIKKKIN